ncbi:MAG: sn-glycerol-3-phosphate ABC transporter ATP-binding protein UgpC [Phycisphaeraceae bacterium]|nr:sn-glycerol-3-phosphate ABC transporter ATP-binding protein UgpC [Phycisphaerales bacterium]QOJ18157.1 MAG: sn-glycerol-3-phosphate ABC transporter ATP-binding protein UgpC [Phycisphaeraceae bacterium]
MATVTLDNVTKTYPGGVEAVRRVNLAAADGEFVVLVGPSGCGKSTTLRMIAGLESVTSGSVSIDGRVVNDVHPKDRNIAMVFQNYALYPHMTVYQNMAFALKLQRTPKTEIDRRVRETAAMLGLTDLLHRRPRALSGGQRQRAAVGRAIVREPACFLFDEPLSNLDVKLRLQTRAELKHLHQRLRTTTIYVTHDQEEAMTLGDRIAVMAEGRIQQFAPPLEVYRRPINRFVAGFVGLPPMNFINGRIERCDGELAFIADGDLRLPVPPGLRNHTLHFLNREAVLGVRPETLRPNAAGASAAVPDVASGEWAIRAVVRVVEPLGDRQDLYCDLRSGQRLIARVDAAHHARPGDEIVFSVQPEAIHLFEPGEYGPHLAYGDGRGPTAGHGPG